MTPEEKERLANYKTMATFNRDQVADFFNLLARETVEQVETPVVPTVEVVEEPKKRGRHKKI